MSLFPEPLLSPLLVSVQDSLPHAGITTLIGIVSTEVFVAVDSLGRQAIQLELLCIRPYETSASLVSLHGATCQTHMVTLLTASHGATYRHTHTVTLSTMSVVQSTYSHTMPVVVTVSSYGGT